MITLAEPGSLAPINEPNTRLRTDSFMCHTVQHPGVAGTTDDRPGSDARSPRDTRIQFVLVVGASLISVSLAAYEIGPASVTPLIRESMGIDAGRAGLIVGTMFGAAVVASLPVGVVLDRTDSRVAVAVAVLALVVVGAWGWVAADRGAYGSLIASRFVGGLAYVVVWNAGIDIVSEAVHPDYRATAVGVFTASGPVGFALGQGTGPAVASAFGWPAVFPAFNALALVGLVLFWPASRGLGRVGERSPPGFGDFGAVFRDRGVWLVAALGFLAYSLYLFVNSWAPSYLTEEVGLSLALSGVLAAVFPAVGVLSRISGGALSDSLFGGRRRPVVLASFVVATPFLATFALSRSLPALVVALLGAGFAIQLTLGLSFSYVRELVPARVAATAVAFLTSVGLAGAFLAPILGGTVIGAGGYDVAFLGAAVLAAVGVVLAWAAPEPG
jgi:predicted MFS family arabinose efflux permease